MLCGAGLPPQVAKAWLQSWKWAAITVAVVTSPVIGKVAKVSFERFAGTIAGTCQTTCASFYLCSSSCPPPLNMPVLAFAFYFPFLFSFPPCPLRDLLAPLPELAKIRGCLVLPCASYPLLVLLILTLPMLPVAFHSSV